MVPSFCQKVANSIKVFQFEAFGIYRNLFNMPESESSGERDKEPVKLVKPTTPATAIGRYWSTTERWGQFEMSGEKHCLSRGLTAWRMFGMSEHTHMPMWILAVEKLYIFEQSTRRAPSERKQICARSHPPTQSRPTRVRARNTRP